MDDRRTRITFDAATGSSPDVDVGRVADAFALLGEPVRLRILLAIAGTRRADWDHAGLPYTDLRRAVDVEDGGRFNYHLDRIEGTFVRKAGDRYRLTYAGSQIVNVVFAGFTGRRVVRERAPIDGEDAAFEAEYDDGRFAIWRVDGEDPLVEMTLPPTAAAGRSLEGLLGLASTIARFYTELAIDGMCPACWGVLQSTISGADDPVGFSCDRCKTTFSLPAWYCVLYHPTIAAWVGEHGYAVDDLRSVATLSEQADVTERGDDPIVVTFAVDDGRRTARLASDGTITVDAP